MKNTPKKISQKTDRKGGLNAYGLPDRKISVFLCLALISTRIKHIFKNIMKQGMLMFGSEICLETWTQLESPDWRLSLAERGTHAALFDVDVLPSRLYW